MAVVVHCMWGAKRRMDRSMLVSYGDSSGPSGAGVRSESMELRNTRLAARAHSNPSVQTNSVQFDAKLRKCADLAQLLLISISTASLPGDTKSETGKIGSSQ